MKSARILAVTWVLFLFACRASVLPTVTIIENDQVITLQTNERIPSALLNQAGIQVNLNDRVLLNGLPITLKQPITTYPITLQIRRAIPITITAPESENQIQSSAFTVGETLQEASIWLRAGDRITPPIDSPISTSPISILPSRELTITSNGGTTQILSSAQTIG